MTAPLQEARRATGFPVEVAVFDVERIDSRMSGSTEIHRFTFAPDTTNDGIFCDAPGYREGSIAWGMTLDPVLFPDDTNDPVVQASAIYVETTQEELRLLIACLQNLYDVNFGDRR